MIPREMMRKIRRIQIHTSHIVDNLLAGPWHSAFKGRGIEFEEVRPYQVGDDVRTIDHEPPTTSGLDPPLAMWTHRHASGQTGAGRTTLVVR